MYKFTYISNTCKHNFFVSNSDMMCNMVNQEKCDLCFAIAPCFGGRSTGAMFAGS